MGATLDEKKHNEIEAPAASTISAGNGVTQRVPERAATSLADLSPTIPARAGQSS